MKKYLLLSVLSLCVVPAWSADAADTDPSSSTPSATDKTSPKLSKQDAVIQELLSQKFYYFGEDLNDKIQEIRENGSFKDLTSSEIESSLATMKAVESEEGAKEQKDDEDGRVSVTVFVKKELKEFKDLEKTQKDQSLRDAFSATAYFPEELDPRTKSFPLVSLAYFKFIHRQLSDAYFYGHPLAGRYLKEIAGICNLPLHVGDADGFVFDINKFNNNGDLSKYDQYSISIKRHKPETQVEQADIHGEDINQEINFPAYSKEVGMYFQELLEQNPEERYKKKRKAKS